MCEVYDSLLLMNILKLLPVVKGGSHKLTRKIFKQFANCRVVLKRLTEQEILFMNSDLENISDTEDMTELRDNLLDEDFYNKYSLDTSSYSKKSLSDLSDNSIDWGPEVTISEETSLKDFEGKINFEVMGDEDYPISIGSAVKITQSKRLESLQKRPKNISETIVSPKQQTLTSIKKENSPLRPVYNDKAIGKNFKQMPTIFTTVKDTENLKLKVKKMPVFKEVSKRRHSRSVENIDDETHTKHRKVSCTKTSAVASETKTSVREKSNKSSVVTSTVRTFDFLGGELEDAVKPSSSKKKCSEPTESKSKSVNDAKNKYTRSSEKHINRVDEPSTPKSRDSGRHRHLTKSRNDHPKSDRRSDRRNYRRSRSRSHNRSRHSRDSSRSKHRDTDKSSRREKHKDTEICIVEEPLDTVIKTVDSVHETVVVDTVHEKVFADTVHETVVADSVRKTVVADSVRKTVVADSVHETVVGDKVSVVVVVEAVEAPVVVIKTEVEDAPISAPIAQKPVNQPVDQVEPVIVNEESTESLSSRIIEKTEPFPDEIQTTNSLEARIAALEKGVTSTKKIKVQTIKVKDFAIGGCVNTASFTMALKLYWLDLTYCKDRELLIKDMTFEDISTFEITATKFFFKNTANDFFCLLSQYTLMSEQNQKEYILGIFRSLECFSEARSIQPPDIEWFTTVWEKLRQRNSVRPELLTPPILVHDNNYMMIRTPRPSPPIYLQSSPQITVSPTHQIENTQNSLKHPTFYPQQNQAMAPPSYIPQYRSQVVHNSSVTPTSELRSLRFNHPSVNESNQPTEMPFSNEADSQFGKLLNRRLSVQPQPERNSFYNTRSVQIPSVRVSAPSKSTEDEEFENLQKQIADRNNAAPKRIERRRFSVAPSSYNNQNQPQQPYDYSQYQNKHNQVHMQQQPPPPPYPQFHRPQQLQMHLSTDSNYFMQNRDTTQQNMVSQQRQQPNFIPNLQDYQNHQLQQNRQQSQQPNQQQQQPSQRQQQQQQLQQQQQQQPTQQQLQQQLQQQHMQHQQKIEQERQQQQQQIQQQQQQQIQQQQKIQKQQLQQQKIQQQQIEQDRQQQQQLQQQQQQLLQQQQLQQILQQQQLQRQIAQQQLKNQQQHNQQHLEDQLHKDQQEKQMLLQQSLQQEEAKRKQKFEEEEARKQIKIYEDFQFLQIREKKAKDAENAAVARAAANESAAKAAAAKKAMEKAATIKETEAKAATKAVEVAENIAAPKVFPPSQADIIAAFSNIESAPICNYAVQLEKDNVKLIESAVKPSTPQISSYCCVVCSSTAIMQCTVCFCASYCSDNCKDANWPIHGIDCPNPKYKP